MCNEQKDNLKLYAITRKDLKPGAQACQMIHAVCEFAKVHPKEYDKWFTTSNYIAILEVENESKLYALLEKAKYFDIKYAAFHEPSFDNQLTSIVLDATLESRRLVKNLKLALRQ